MKENATSASKPYFPTARRTPRRANYPDRLTIFAKYRRMKDFSSRNEPLRVSKKAKELNHFCILSAEKSRFLNDS